VKQRLRGNRTSLSAELAGIARAAEIANDEDITEAIETGKIEGVVIATDCDVAITLIENAVYDDTPMCGAPEEDKLREAVANMKKLKGKTTLIKVRGHVGITGNKAADEAAKAAREMDEPDSDSDDERQPAPAQICVALKTDGTVCTVKNQDEIIKRLKKRKC
jgi:ribonuclease HI